MCGIAGFISAKEQNQGTIHRTLQGIESRGGHAWGWANEDQYHKAIGKVPTITKDIELPKKSGQIMILHSRWATHGSADDIACAHPFVSQRYAVVHNGVIQNDHPGQKTKCDSEAILKLMIDHNDPKKVAEELNGDFRIAIIDKQLHKLIIINDRCPVWFGKRFQSELWFASESKHLPADCWMRPGKENTIMEFWIEKGEIRNTIVEFQKKTKIYNYNFSDIDSYYGSTETTHTPRKGAFNIEVCKECEKVTCYQCPLLG